MKKILFHVSRGIGYLPNCGDHPGLPVLVVTILAGSNVGFYLRGVVGMIFGVLVVLSIIGPLFLYGAYARSKNYELDQKSKK